MNGSKYTEKNAEKAQKRLEHNTRPIPLFIETAHFDPETGNDGTMMWRSVLLRNPTGEAQPDDPAGDLFHGLQERIGTQSSGGADTLPPSSDTSFS